MTPDPIVPDIVFTLWGTLIALALVLFVPLSVYSLHTLYRAVGSVRRYARDGVAAARAIEANTGAIPATHATIGVAMELVAAAESVAARLDTIATALESRAGRK